MKRYINREISWLSFNERVLQEAQNVTTPLLERLKFLGIFSSNQDEFFSVRVGSLQSIVQSKVLSSKIINKAKRIKREINTEAIRLRNSFDETFTEVKSELEKEGIFFIDEQSLTTKHENQLAKFYRKKLRPRLIPIMLDENREFPYLENAQVYMAIILKSSNDLEFKKYALIQLPADEISRFHRLKDEKDNYFILMIDDIIRLHLKDIFSFFDADIFEAYTIKLTRSAEINLNKDITISFFEKISESIEQRNYGEPVRFVYDDSMPLELLDFILRKLDLSNVEHIIPSGKYQNIRDFISFPKIKRKKLYYEDVEPLIHPRLENKRSILAEIAEKDLLLNFPYQTFDHIVDLLREAAIDPKVISIKMTLYRVAKRSNVVNALINAAKNGKKVSVLLELQARFDEKANMKWIEKLEKEDVNIINGFPEMKVHSKLLMITREENNKHVDYCVIGTGNYNEATATVYTDHALLTKDKRITKDVETLFKYLELNYSLKLKYKHLLVSPLFLRSKLTKLINTEIKNAKEGDTAYIYLKLNNLVDTRMIDLLRKAASHGVQVKLIVRGICSLIPDEKESEAKIEIISIVDKFLEHSRLYVFGNKGKPKYFLSSADLMSRNLDRRIEVAAPIYDDDIKKEIWDYLMIQFSDNVKARVHDSSLNNDYQVNELEPIRAQVAFYEYLKNKDKNEIRMDI